MPIIRGGIDWIPGCYYKNTDDVFYNYEWGRQLPGTNVYQTETIWYCQGITECEFISRHSARPIKTKVVNLIGYCEDDYLKGSRQGEFIQIGLVRWSLDETFGQFVEVPPLELLANDDRIWTPPPD